MKLWHAPYARVICQFISNDYNYNKYTYASFISYDYNFNKYGYNKLICYDYK